MDIDKINFRSSYIEQLTKFFILGIADVYVPIEVNDQEIEIKLNKEKQKLIRLIAVKDNKTFSKSKKENYKIGAIISSQK